MKLIFPGKVLARVAAWGEAAAWDEAAAGWAAIVRGQALAGIAFALLAAPEAPIRQERLVLR